jgi:hypothetical protein
MDVDYTTIRPGIGLGNLKFGASQEQVRAYLGEPEVIDDSGVPSGWLPWQYPTIGVDASFDEEYSYRLLSLSIRNEKATLFGHRIIGLSSKSALETAAQCPLGKYKRVEDELGWEAEFNDSNLEFRFDGDHLWLISWRVIIDKDDVVHWPD